MFLWFRCTVFGEHLLIKYNNRLYTYVSDQSCIFGWSATVHQFSDYNSNHHEHQCDRTNQSDLHQRTGPGERTMINKVKPMFWI